MNATTPAGTPSTRRALVSIWATFFLAGALTAGWTVRIPAVKAKLQLSDGQLGLEVLGWGLASLLAMQFAGRLITRFGSRRLLQIVLPGVALSLIPVGLAPSFPALIAAGVLYGLLFGILEVAMNVQASAAQVRTGSSIMGRMHAGWSIGAVAGGLIGALLARLGVDFTAAMVSFAVVGVVPAIAAGRGFLPEVVTERPAGGDRVRLARIVTLLAVVTFCVFLTEGAVADWSGILLHEHLGATEAAAALAYPLFEGVMAAGRLVGERRAERVRPRLVIAVAGGVAAIAFGISAAAGDAAIALVGFVVGGAAMCLVGPLSMSLAGAHDRRTTAAATARLSTFGYSGMLLGPVVIGLAGDRSSLPLAFGVTVVLACVGWAAVGWLGIRVADRRQDPQPEADALRPD